MLLNPQIRLIAAILILMITGWWVKQYREKAHDLVPKVKTRAKR